MRLPVSILVLFALAALALWFHQNLGAGGSDGTAQAALGGELRDDTERRVVLRAGGTRPIVEQRRAPATPPPAPIDPAPVDPRPAGPGEHGNGSGPQPLDPPPAPRRAEYDTAVLEDSETIYGLVVRHYGDSKRLAEVLRFNELTEQSARKVRPGTVIRLPR